MTNLGSMFRARREERGCTIEDIAARTKIPLRLLVELEGNTFTHWPASRVYRIGYLRAYARAVGFDEARVIAQYDADIAAHPVHPAAASANDVRSTEAARKFPAFSPALVFACILLGAFLIGVAHYVGPERPVAAQTPGVSMPPADITLEPATDVTTAVPTSGGTVAADDVEGELRIDSIPTGTHVVVNGIARGTTPLRLQYLPAGSYTIRLVRAGFESKEASATITSEQRIRSISITLSER